MKKYYSFVFLFPLLFYWPEAVAQVSRKSMVLGYELYRNKAKSFFDAGDYVRAKNLYKVCRDLPGVSPENQIEILTEIRRTIDIERLREEADYKLRQGDENGARLAYNKILSPRFNPNDISVKDKLAELSKPSEQRNIPADLEKWEKQADKYLTQKSPDYQRANEILRIIPIDKRSPAVLAKLNLTRDLPYRISLINKKRSAGLSVEREIKELENKYPDSPLVNEEISRLKDETEYWEKSRTAERHVATCRFEQAKIIYKDLRPKFPQFARVLIGRINNLQRITQRINEVATLRTDTDPFKQTQVLYNYSLLYQSSRKCIEEDYFEYVFSRGVRQMQNNKLPEAIINFERAFSISKSLANHNKVPALADSCRRLLACQKQFQVYKSMLDDAELLYRRCFSDSAVELYKKAQLYSCKKNDSKLEKTWQNRLTSVAQNRQKQSDFVALVSKANNLLENRRCEEALLLYRQADSTQVDCRQLDKSILRITECIECMRQQCFDTLIVKAERSREANFRRDELRYYRAALKCPAPESLTADIQRKIADLECLVENKNCPPPPPLPPLNSFFKPSIIVGGNGFRPSLYKEGKPILSSPAITYGTGIRLERISFVKPVDFRADLHYMNYSFNHLNEEGLIRQSFKISTVEGSLGLKLHTTSRNKSRIRPYVFGSVGYNIPVAYKSEDYALAKKFISTEDLSSGFASARSGVGFEIQKPKWGMSLETYYGISRKDLFLGEPKKSFQNENNYSSPKATLLGIELGLRLW